MSKAFERLMTTIRPHLPGAVDEAIIQELFLACQDYFKKSMSWQEELDFVVRAGEDRGMVMPFAGRIDMLVGVMNRDRRQVFGAFMPDNGTVALRHRLHADETFTAVVTLTVTDPTDKKSYPIIPAPVVEAATDDLIHGILSRMMSQPSKPYTNLMMAQFHGTKFNGGASRARNAVRTGNVFGGQAWQFPQQFRTVR